MNKNTIQTIKAIILGLVLSLGVSYVSAVNTWAPPPGNPPTCPSGYPGCDAPLNIGDTDQHKVGGLRIGDANAPTSGYKLDVPSLSFFGGIVTTSFKLLDGNNDTGKVLTSDANGLASWQTPTGGGGGVTKIFPGTGINITSTNNNGTGDVTINSSREVTGNVSGGILGNCTMRNGRQVGMLADQWVRVSFTPPFNSGLNINVVTVGDSSGSSDQSLNQTHVKDVTTSDFWVRSQQPTAIQYIAIACQ